MVRRVARVLLEVLPSTALIFTALTILEAATATPILVPLKAALAMIGGIGYLFLLRWVSAARGNSVDLRTDREEFVKYYVEWYSKPGRIFIRCSDMHWLTESAERARILSVLLERASKLEIFIDKPSGSALKDLVESGARAFIVPENFSERVKFSLRMDEDYDEVILRSKPDAPKGSSKSNLETVKHFTDEQAIALVRGCFDLLKTGKQLKSEDIVV